MDGLPDAQRMVESIHLNTLNKFMLFSTLMAF